MAIVYFNFQIAYWLSGFVTVTLYVPGNFPSKTAVSFFGSPWSCVTLFTDTPPAFVMLTFAPRRTSSPAIFRICIPSATDGSAE